MILSDAVATFGIPAKGIAMNLEIDEIADEALLRS